MKKTRGVWRQRVKQLIFAGVALPVVLAVIAVFQVVFFPVSKEDAISKATNEFHKFCHTEGLNPDFFEGPSIDPASGNSVFFSGGYYLVRGRMGNNSRWMFLWIEPVGRSFGHRATLKSCGCDIEFNDAFYRRRVCWLEKF